MALTSLYSFSLFSGFITAVTSNRPYLRKLSEHSVGDVAKRKRVELASSPGEEVQMVKVRARGVRKKAWAPSSTVYPSPATSRKSVTNAAAGAFIGLAAEWPSRNSGSRQGQQLRPEHASAWLARGTQGRDAVVVELEAEVHSIELSDWWLRDAQLEAPGRRGTTRAGEKGHEREASNRQVKERVLFRRSRLSWWKREGDEEEFAGTTDVYGETTVELLSLELPAYVHLLEISIPLRTNFKSRPTIKEEGSSEPTPAAVEGPRPSNSTPSNRESPNREGPVRASIFPKPISRAHSQSSHNFRIPSSAPGPSAATREAGPGEDRGDSRELERQDQAARRPTQARRGQRASGKYAALSQVRRVPLLFGSFHIFFGHYSKVGTNFILASPDHITFLYVHSSDKTLPRTEPQPMNIPCWRAGNS
ncbi:hypothetical protein BU16DRAFT_535522 [Lophium mytilinum]|uniref:Uncharacterized protein n=1 Tax=Lophium mytilinum TaxID=390894 RepID=A0A6A6R6K7_9PEZI|nr:hypothetical protein BU16DRAFT_535522 [Lophium mytilinum]